MTGGGRINWAGEEHFGYSRPSGPCLDRTFNAIVSMFASCFSLGKWAYAQNKPLAILLSVGRVRGRIRGGNTELAATVVPQ